MIYDAGMVALLPLVMISRYRIPTVTHYMFCLEVLVMRVSVYSLQLTTVQTIQQTLESHNYQIRLYWDNPDISIVSHRLTSPFFPMDSFLTIYKVGARILPLVHQSVRETGRQAENVQCTVKGLSNKVEGLAFKKTVNRLQEHTSRMHNTLSYNISFSQGSIE